MVQPADGGIAAVNASGKEGQTLVLGRGAAEGRQLERAEITGLEQFAGRFAAGIGGIGAKIEG